MKTASEIDLKSGGEYPPGISTEIKADKEKLLTVFWDYDIDGDGDDVYDFLIGMKELEGFNRKRVIARVLTSIRWYELIDIFGLEQVYEFLDEEVLKYIWKKSVKNRYRSVRETLQGIL